MLKAISGVVFVRVKTGLKAYILWLLGEDLRRSWVGSCTPVIIQRCCAYGVLAPEYRVPTLTCVVAAKILRVKGGRGGTLSFHLRENQIPKGPFSIVKQSSI